MPTYTYSTVPADRPPALSAKTGDQPTADTNLTEESDYESDSGSHYSPKSVLGNGASARARRFESSAGKAVVVIDPVSPRCVDASEVRRKFHFFTSQYPEKYSQIFEHFEERADKKKRLCSYRLVVPFVSGVTYKKYIESFGRIKDIDRQIHFFMSLVAELKALHAKGLVYIDFKRDNVLYDASTGQSHLIDGGSSNKCGYPLPSIFSLATQETLADVSKTYGYVAPECWTVKPSPLVAAHPSMDVFSLGYCLRHKLFEFDLDADMLALICSCILPDPTARPTLDDLSVALNALLCKRTYQGYLQFVQSIVGDKTDPLYCLLQWIAQSFLLDTVIRSHDRSNNEEQDIYSLQALPESEQPLFLEIAGLVLFSYASRGKLAELELPSRYKVSMEGDILTIRYKTVVSVVIEADNTDKTVDVFDKKSWKINKTACESAFSALSQKHPKLESFTYNIATPVSSALELWNVLTREQRRTYAFSCVIC